MAALISHIVAAHARVGQNPSLDEDAEVQQAVVTWLEGFQATISSPPEYDLLAALLTEAKET